MTNTNDLKITNANVSTASLSVRVAKFDKVSYEQFEKDIEATFPSAWTKAEIHSFYNEIRLPKRATKGSAGYDFFSPIPFNLNENQDIKVPTGIRAIIDDGWCLTCLPRSGMGFKYYLRLANTIGLIDADFAGSSNEGHIFLKFRLESNSILSVKAGDAIAQGLFLPHGITYDDSADGIRNGGMGSTGA